MFGNTTNNSKSGNKLAALLGYDKTPRMSDEQLHILNYDYLMGLSKYLVKQKKAGAINDKEFNFLMSTVGGNFIEREMEIRINKVFRKIF